VSILTLNDLLSVASASEILAIELSIAQGLGLPTTAWQPLSMVRTLLATQAELGAQFAVDINLLAQGGYASLAAKMVDALGNPITSWMDLIAQNNYNEVRVPITFASGSVPVNNPTATAYPYAIGQLHFQNPTTGATYANTQAGTILSATSNQGIAVQADQAWGGAIGTSGAGVALTLITPLPGVTVSPLVNSLVGQDAETNPNLFTRLTQKLGTLSVLGKIANPAPPNPGGANQAYAFLAKSIPQGSVASPTYPFAVVTPITRVTVIAAGGGVIVYVANAAGQPPPSDTAAVSAALQLLATPQGVTATVYAASNAPLNLSYRVYVTASGNLSTAQITTNISSALAQYLATVPIGGHNTSAPNIVPRSDIIATILDANPGTLDVQITAPSGGDFTLLPQQVPVVGTLVPTVVQV
jgi:hypothetical protein